VSARSIDFLAALRADIVRVLVEQTGAPEGHVMGMAAQIIEVTQRRFGADSVYIRKPAYDPDAVLSDFDGRNHAAVCRKHQISRRTLYRVLHRQRRGS
jgi:Mor family transcriptional regulator